LNEPLYFIALVTEGTLAEKIRDIQLHCSETYQSKKALRSPPHITLIPPFRQDESIENVLEKKLTPFFRNYHPFRLELNGFGRFDNRVIFIKPEKNSDLQKLEEELRNFLSADFPFVERIPSRPYNPHVTIASGDLRKKFFHSAWQEFEQKKFNEIWNVSSAHLLRHDGKRWNPTLKFVFSSSTPGDS
jgi:2'-5' RNA ligase